MTDSKRVPTPRDFLADDAWRDARSHAAEDLDSEVGGFLVGSISRGRAKAVAAIPARLAEGSAAQLTFPPEAWTAIHEAIDARGNNERIVGWYHSHPGHGVFLSGYDRFIQSQFFPENGQIAVVIDPHTGQEGVFASRNGDIETRLVRQATRISGETRQERAGRLAKRQDDLRSLAAVAIAVVLGGALMFLLGYRTGFDAANRDYARGVQDGGRDAASLTPTPIASSPQQSVPASLPYWAGEQR